MKKLAFIISTVVGTLLLGYFAFAQSISSPNYWRTNIASSTITPLNALLQVPCANIVGGCSGSSGGLASTTPFTIGDLAVVSSSGALSTIPTSTYYLSTNPSAYLAGVTASTPLSGSGTVGSPLIFTNPGYVTSSTGLTYFFPATSTVFLSTSTGLTTSNFASPNISQWTNNSGYITTSTNNFGGLTNASITATAPITWSAGSVIGLSIPLASTYGGTATTTALGTNAFSSVAFVPQTTQVNSGGILSGGGALSGNQTISLSTSTLNTNVAALGFVTSTSGSSLIGTTQTSSPYLTALGSGAGASTTGNYDTYLGFNSGFLSTSGQYNTGVGYDTLYSDPAGTNYNTAVGSNALYTLSSGSNNTALGYNTLYNETSGGFNFGLGYQSLFDNVSGSNNIGIGSYAGYNYLGSNAFFVGENAQSSAANDQNYSLLYGNFAGVAATTTGQFLTVNGKLNASGNFNASGTISQAGVALGTNAFTSTPIPTSYVASNIAGTGISVSGATGNVTISNTGVTSFNGSTGAVTGVSSLNSATGSVSLIEGSAGNIAIQTTTTSTAILAAPLSIEDLVPTTSTPDVFHFPNTTTTISKILCNNLAVGGNTFTFGLIASTTIGTGSATNTVLSAGMTCNSTTTDQSTTTFSNAVVPPNAIGQIWYSVASTTGSVISIYF